MAKRLSVIDGADQGRVFPLPEVGAVLIGSSRGETNIFLHDPDVASIHCEVEIKGGRVSVTNREAHYGTLVNGARITQRALQPGDVIRIGRSFLRLEERESQPRDEPDDAPPASQLPSTSLPYLPPERLGELTGLTLGNFQLGPLLGHGHYGPVFRAHDVKRDQAVAVKVLPPIFPADKEEMERFVAAVKPVLFLQHPGLVLLRGIGKTGPYVWLARQLIDGESLAARLQRPNPRPRIKWRPALRNEVAANRALEWRFALRVAVQITRALEFMHRRHLLHLNVTPGNILLDAETGVARLNDLGFWEALVGSKLQQKVLEGKFLAELPYLSPEQVDPDAAVDEFSDQYSLGAVIYTLLTGRPPCQGKTPEETIAQIRSYVPTKPKKVQRFMPDEFQAVVLRMLAKRPEERYTDPGSLLEELKNIATNQGEDV